MHGLQSPQYSSSSKPDHFSSKAQHLTKQRSPSFRSIRSPSSRNQRIPSQDQYLCSSNHNLRSSKQESPSKCSQDLKRRKSQLVEQQPLSSSKKKQRSGQTQNAQQIINSIQDLKEEYRILREAYKELIQEKVRHTEEMTAVRSQNGRLKNQIQELTQKQLILTREKAALTEALEAVQRQLQQERRQAKKLENDLYFYTQREKSKTDYLSLNTNPVDIDAIFTNPKFTEPQHTDNPPLQEIDERIASNNESHLLSFSLTSLIDESLRQDPFKMRKEHVKVVSDLSRVGGLHEQFGNIELKPKRQGGNTFKKQKKEEQKGNPLSQLLCLKSPLSSEKKQVKNLCVSSSTKRRKAEQKENVQPRHQKKRSKKILQIGGTNE